jgi:Nuclease-related domain
MAEKTLKAGRADAYTNDGAELTLAAALEDAVETVGGLVLHNRRMPGGRGEIDHIAIVPAGVHVIDTKTVTGKIEIRRPWLKPDQLFIAGRDRTTYIDGLDRQAQAVRDAIDRIGCRRLAVRGALCFTGADLPFLRTQDIRGHLLLYRKALVNTLVAGGPLSADARVALASVLTALFRAG